MTHEHSRTDAGSAFDGDGEQALYGKPRHEVGGDYDEQSLYGDPQHDSSGEIDEWDVELLFARMQFAPIGPDELGPRTNPSAAESTER